MLKQLEGINWVSRKSWGVLKKHLTFGTLKRKIITHNFIENVFPSELMEYFDVSGFQELCSVKDKLEYWLIDFEEKNNLPNGFPQSEYESKGFMGSKLIQDFPIRGKGVYLRIKKRRWRHKKSGKAIQSDFSFMADGSKFTQELSDFLKGASGYATRYHHQYSQLLPG
jgi:hypothetical protein